jgi:hypothetical protein
MKVLEHCAKNINSNNNDGYSSLYLFLVAW